MSREVDYLDVDDLLDLSALQFGGRPAIRDVGLLGSAAARPQATAFGDDAYPDIWTKAAALLQSIVKNHALIDGNKRLGWLATAVFLELNGVAARRVPNEEVYDLVMGVAAGQDEVGDIAARLRGLLRARRVPRPK